MTPEKKEMTAGAAGTYWTAWRGEFSRQPLHPLLCLPAHPSGRTAFVVIMIGKPWFSSWAIFGHQPVSSLVVHACR